MRVEHPKLPAQFQTNKFKEISELSSDSNAVQEMSDNNSQLLDISSDVEMRWELPRPKSRESRLDRIYTQHNRTWTCNALSCHRNNKYARDLSKITRNDLSQFPEWFKNDLAQCVLTET